MPNSGGVTHSFEDGALGRLLDNQSAYLLCYWRSEEALYNGMETFPDKRALWPEHRAERGRSGGIIAKWHLGMHIKNVRKEG